MAHYDFRAPRLFVEASLSPGACLELDRGQINYLVNVLRLRAGDAVLAFNGRDGEWRAELGIEGRRHAELVCRDRVRDQTPPLDLLYLFAPLKHARLDYMVQKAVEMGVNALQPVHTQHTQSSRVNLERMRSNAIEAAEQCGVLAVPEIRPDTSFAAALQSIEPDRLLVFCDEAAPLSNPIAALAAHRNRSDKFAVIVGPEGGFTAEERARAAARVSCVPVSLGPRILRADTAAVAVLAIFQAVLGDWQ